VPPPKYPETIPAAFANASRFPRSFRSRRILCRTSRRCRPSSCAPARRGRIVLLSPVSHIRSQESRSRGSRGFEMTASSESSSRPSAPKRQDGPDAQHLTFPWRAPDPGLGIRQARPAPGSPRSPIFSYRSAYFDEMAPSRAPFPSISHGLRGAFIATRLAALFFMAANSAALSNNGDRHKSTWADVGEHRS